MTNSAQFFSAYVICPNNRRIVIADGSIIIVAKVRTIKLSPHFTLIYVLHVPKLYTKLISIIKLSQDLNYKVIVFPLFLNLDQNSRRTISHAEARNT